MGGVTEVPARRLILVRHGHYDRVGDLGDDVWGLSALGRKQAARTARRLARMLAVYPGLLEGLYASPWPRALQTAQIAARELELDRVRVTPYLHECIPLVPAPEAGGGLPIHPTLPVTGADERRWVHDQVERVIARFFKPSKRSSAFLLFTHGNLIRYLVADTLGLPFETWMRIDCSHASITEIRVFPGGFRALVSYNETSHLPPDLVSS